MMLFSSPHLHGGDSIRAQMLTVIVALLPASAAAVWFFGWLALLLILLCMGGCIAFEALALRMMGRPQSVLGDGSAALTGLLFALTLPPFTPWWMALLGCAIAIVLSKQIYGGLGYNPFNPALVARIALLVSFPLQMTQWLSPLQAPLFDPFSLVQSVQLLFAGPASLGLGFDALASASPLGQIKTEWRLGVPVSEALAQLHYSTLDALVGREAGSIGETSALALMAGGVLLLARHVITWHIPLAYLATVALLAAIFNTIDPAHYAPPLFHLLAGGLLLCALFMATDPVTSPVTPRGKILFGIGCGLLTWVIRTYGGYPEGAMFAVVLMNALVPLFDRYLRPRVYGHGGAR